MTASYNGETGPDYDSLLDSIALTSAGDDLTAIARTTGAVRTDPMTGPEGDWNTA